VGSVVNNRSSESAGTFADSLILPGEKHFRNMRQLTFKGDNAEAYWSFNGKKLIFQATNPDWQALCDQIFVIDVEGTQPARRISLGRGRTTCAYFLPGDSLVLYASTHQYHGQCPSVPERKPGSPYLWALYPEYDIYIADLQGNIRYKLTDRFGYDAEATVSPKGDRIVFTSDRSGDLELWTCKLDGSDLKQITNELGYDGGAFFSPDGEYIVFRASRPRTEEEVRTYHHYLSQGLVAPTQMEIFMCRADGSELRQVTRLGKANWAPFFHPSGRKIIFSSNHHSDRGFKFNLFMINVDGTGLEQISFDRTFDAFPMFSPDGRYISFSSNRNNAGTHDTNIFVAEWVD
jgi:Tol biopolymer transport system component